MRAPAVLGAVLAALALAAPAEAAPPPLPSSMAAIGDSITLAYDACCSFGAHPERSWSTGTLASDSVRSLYERLAAANPALAGHAVNLAASGAVAADARAQADRAVAFHAQYVTVLIGGNDACADSVAAMTPVAAFRRDVDATLARLAGGLPAGAHVFVASIPDLYRLWQVLHTDPRAQNVWDFAGLCQALLSSHATGAERRAVRDRVTAYDRVLRASCARHALCRYDGGAVHAYRFRPSESSAIDFFHPSEAGQAALARVTAAASWWPSVS